MSHRNIYIYVISYMYIQTVYAMAWNTNTKCSVQCNGLIDNSTDLTNVSVSLLLFVLLNFIKFYYQQFKLKIIL